MRFLAALLIIPFVIAFSGCREAAHEADINEFLQSHDPALKAKRDELVSTITSTRNKRDKLEALVEKYRSHSAKANLQRQIGLIDTQLRQLKAALTAIDEKIEVAMVNRDIDRADAGGLRDAEATALLENTSRIINHAKDLEQNFNQALSESSINQATPSPKPITVTPAEQPPPPQAEPPPTPIDRHSLEQKLRQINAAISNTEANLKNAWNTIHRLTNHGTKPIEKYSRDYNIYLSARRIRIACEARLPLLKAEKENIQIQLKALTE